MKRDSFIALEQQCESLLALQQLVDSLAFNEQGLTLVILLWLKDEASGHTQGLIFMSFDYDGGAVFCQVEQQGAACHLGRESCFYLRVCPEAQQVDVEGEPPSS